MIALALAVDTVVAAGQGWVLRSGGDCAATPCSVATLGGHPMVCLVLSVAAALTLAAGWLVRQAGDPPGWDAVRWSGIALTVVATTGAVVVAAAAVILTLLGARLLVACVRVLDTR